MHKQMALFCFSFYWYAVCLCRERKESNPLILVRNQTGKLCRVVFNASLGCVQTEIPFVSRKSRSSDQLPYRLFCFQKSGLCFPCTRNSLLPDAYETRRSCKNIPPIPFLEKDAFAMKAASLESLRQEYFGFSWGMSLKSGSVWVTVMFNRSER